MGIRERDSPALPPGVPELQRGKKQVQGKCGNSQVEDYKTPWSPTNVKIYDGIHPKYWTATIDKIFSFYLSCYYFSLGTRGSEGP